MHDPFLDSATLDGQRRVREYVLGWLERLDYAGKLDRAWPADELGALIWQRVESEFGAHWQGSVVTNRPLAEVIAATMVEDYLEAFPERRASRYSVAGPLPDAGFRRCVLDFVHDLEEFEPALLSSEPEVVAEVFWRDVRTSPGRWGYAPQTGPFVDDEARAGLVVLETVDEYFSLLQRVAAQRRELQSG